MVIAIARLALSTTRRSKICQVVIINILVDDLCPIQWSTGQEVAWLVLPAAWWLNLYPEIIATILREMLAGAVNRPRAGCLLISPVDLIPESTWDVSPPIVHVIAGFVKYLLHIRAEHCPPLPKR
jgi:hypothetical protein